MNEMKIDLNVVSNDNHVPTIERSFGKTNEIVRCIQTTIPVKKLPKGITIEIFAARIFWLKPPQTIRSDRRTKSQRYYY